MIAKTRKPLSIVGVGAAACAACCVGPIVVFLAATGLFTAAGTALFGAAGLLVLIPAAVWYARRRRGATTCTVTDDGPVPVALMRRP